MQVNNNQHLLIRDYQQNEVKIQKNNIVKPKQIRKSCFN